MSFSAPSVPTLSLPENFVWGPGLNDYPRVVHVVWANHDDDNQNGVADSDEFSLRPLPPPNITGENDWLPVTIQDQVTCGVPSNRQCYFQVGLGRLWAHIATSTDQSRIESVVGPLSQLSQGFMRSKDDELYVAVVGPSVGGWQQLPGRPSDWAGKLFYEPYVSTNGWPSIMSIKVTGTTATGRPFEFIHRMAFLTLFLDVYDMRYWGPKYNSALQIPYCDPVSLNDVGSGTEGSVPVEFQPGGAITDGASVCLLRIRGLPRHLQLAALKAELTDMVVRLVKDLPSSPATSTSETFPAAVGGEIRPYATRGQGASQSPALPILPTVLPEFGFSDGILSDNGLGFYIPPGSFTDLLWHPGNSNGGVQSHESLGFGEVCRTSFRGRFNGQDMVGGRSWYLRRPPLVLIHGIYSSSATWSPLLWNENGIWMPTRIYKADYSLTHHKGFSENYPILVRAIDDAIKAYRNADDGFGHNPNRSFRGVRYAATRADVVGHSQGGQLARWYIADTVTGQPAIIQRGGGWTEPIDNSREENDPQYRRPYLRNDNWGAGSIRRLITLNSPFKGSPFATFSEGTMAPPQGGLNTRINRWGRDMYNNFPEVSRLVDQSTSEICPYVSRETSRKIIRSRILGDEHTCIADLKHVDSIAYSVLEQATYPSNHQRVLWHPISSVVGVNAPPEYVRFSSAGVVEGWIATNATVIALLLTNTNSDWVVSLLSQVNLPPPTSLDPRSRGTSLTGIAHSDQRNPAGQVVLLGPTSSPQVASIVWRLLSIQYNATDFDPNWNIGP